MTKHLAASALAAFAALALVACGSDSGPGSGSESDSANDRAEASAAAESASSTPPQSPTRAVTPTVRPSADPGTDASAQATSSARDSGAVEITAAGTEVAVGDTVTVPATYAKEEIVVRLTVTAIEQGRSADLEGIGLKEDPETLTPYYIRVTGELMSDNGGQYDPAADLDGLNGEQTASPLITRGTFAPCESRTFGRDAGRGAVVESCTTAVVEAGHEVDAAMYSASSTPYDMFDGEPVIWR